MGLSRGLASPRDGLLKATQITDRKDVALDAVAGRHVVAVGRQQRCVIGADEAIEGAPDTTVLLSNGRRYMVKEAVSDLLEKTAAWKRRCWQSPLSGDAAEARKAMAERAEQER